MEQLKPSYTVGRSTNGTASLENCWYLSKDKHGYILLPTSYILMYPTETHTVDTKNIKIVNIFHIIKNWKNCSSTIERINKFSYVHKMGFYIVIKFSVVILYTITFINLTNITCHEWCQTHKWICRITLSLYKSTQMK